MKKHNTFIKLLLLSMILISCKDRKIEQFKITIVLTHELGNPSDPLNNGLKSLCNYIIDTACTDKVFVPKITIVRPDISPEKTDSIIVPLSWLNKWRKSVNMLLATNLMEDYDDNLQKLTTPEIIGLKSQQPIDFNQQATKYTDAKLVAMNDSMVAQINKIKSEIAHELCSKSGSNYTIILYSIPSTIVGSPQATSMPGVEDGDDCHYEFCRDIKKKLLEIGTCSSEKKYDERFELAKRFVASYLSDKTQIELLSPEGISVDNYSGKKSKTYIFELANENRCVLDFKIPVITTTSDGKISLLRLREYDKK